MQFIRSESFGWTNLILFGSCKFISFKLILIQDKIRGGEGYKEKGEEGF